MNDTVVGGTGAFANHVRFLVVLDDRYRGRMIRHNEQSFQAQAGPDWCSYSDLVAGHLDGVPPDIVREMEQKMEVHDLSNVDSKMKFAREQLYPLARSWHNWLEWEWTYRDQLQPLVHMAHDYDGGGGNTLLLTMDPEQAYLRYIKFNSNLNQMSRRAFTDIAQALNQKFQQLAGRLPNVHVLDAGRLWTGQLPRDWYQEMCGVFGLEDRYDHAQQVHALWYEAHLRSEREIVAYFSEIYSKDK
jgi:hypothetical protein